MTPSLYLHMTHLYSLIRTTLVLSSISTRLYFFLCFYLLSNNFLLLTFAI